MAARESLSRGVGPAVEFEPVVTRVYPEGDLARSLLGSVTTEGKGGSGLELVLDTILSGTPGQRVGRRDAHGELYPIPTSPNTLPHPGRDVYLTIDANLQAIAEAALASALEQTGASGGDVLMADPRTGEILAVASRRGGSIGTVPAFTSPYEPGSTVKPFLLATLLAEDLARLDDRVYAEHGTYRTAHRVITDVHPYDTITVSEVIQVSSNIGAAKLAGRIEPGVQYRYLRDFGFGTPTGIDLPGESAGLLRRPDQWSSLSSASLAIGYEMMTTSLQLVMAYGALANGGTLLEPALVREVRSGAGSVWHFETQPIRQVIDSSTARRVSEVLQAAVEAGGTGTEAFSRDPEDRRQDRHRTHRFRWWLCRPTLRGILRRIHPGARSAARDHGEARGSEGARLRRPHRGARHTNRRAGDRRDSRPWADRDRQGPLIRARLDWETGAPAGSPYRLAAAENVSEARVAERNQMLPDLRGLETRVAVSRLHALGLRVELKGSGRVVRQEPPAGTRVVRGATILLR